MNTIDWLQQPDDNDGDDDVMQASVMLNYHTIERMMIMMMMDVIKVKFIFF